jgi:hypothetical protein
MNITCFLSYAETRFLKEKKKVNVKGGLFGGKNQWEWEGLKVMEMGVNMIEVDCMPYENAIKKPIKHWGPGSSSRVPAL